MKKIIMIVLTLAATALYAGTVDVPLPEKLIGQCFENNGTGVIGYPDDLLVTYFCTVPVFDPLSDVQNPNQAVTSRLDRIANDFKWKDVRINLNTHAHLSVKYVDNVLGVGISVTCKKMKASDCSSQFMLNTAEAMDKDIQTSINFSSIDPTSSGYVCASYTSGGGYSTCSHYEPIDSNGRYCSSYSSEGNCTATEAVHPSTCSGDGGGC